MSELATYGAVERMVAELGVEGAIGELIDGDATDSHDAGRIDWPAFLRRAAFAVHRRTDAEGRRLALRQIAYDDDDDDIAAVARQHGAQHGDPPLHLLHRPATLTTVGTTVLRSGPSGVLQVIWLTDGWLVAVTAAGEVMSWSLPSLEPAGRAELPRIRSAVDVDGARVVVACADGSVHVIDVRVGVTRCLGVATGVPAWSVARVGLDAVVTGSQDGHVRVIGLHDGLRTVARPHSGPVRHVVGRLDGTVLSAGYDGSAVLMDDGLRLTAVSQHGQPVRSVAWNGVYACSADDRGTVLVRGNGGVGPALCLAGPDRGVHHVLLTRSGRLVMADFDGTLRLADPGTGEILARARRHTARVRRMLEAPDGGLLTASDDRTVRHWDRRLRETARLIGHVGWVRGLALLGDGRIASGGADRTVRVWPAGPLSPPPDGHLGWVRSIWPVRPGSVATGAEDGTVRLWDVDTGTESGRWLVGDETIRALHGASDMLAAGDDGGAVHVAMLGDTTTLVTSTAWQTGSRVRALRLLADGTLVTAHGDGRLLQWEPWSATLIREGPSSAGGWRTLDHVGATEVVAGDEGGQLVTWDPARDVVRELPAHRGRVWCSAGLDRRRHISVGFDRMCRLWDLSNGRLMAETGAPIGDSWGLARIDAETVVVVSPIGVLRQVRLGDMSVTARADLRSAAVAVGVATTRAGAPVAVVGGDAPRPSFVAMGR